MGWDYGGEKQNDASSKKGEGIALDINFTYSFWWKEQDLEIQLCSAMYSCVNLGDSLHLSVSIDTMEVIISSSIPPS